METEGMERTRVETSHPKAVQTNASKTAWRQDGDTFV
jgi:hypothetical protein